MTAFQMPDHADIDEAMIGRLVDNFYSKVQQDPRLGPVFDANISLPWAEHLVRMKSFWTAVVLKTGRYDGRPMPAHIKLRDVIKPADFSIWLSLFRETAVETCGAEIAPCFIKRAEAIAENLQRGVFFGFGIVPAGAFVNGEYQKDWPQ